MGYSLLTAIITMKLSSSFSRLSTILLFCSVLLLSCAKEKATTAPSAELVAATNGSIPSSETSQFLNIQTSGQWNISVNYMSGGIGWLTLSATSGAGDANVVLNCSQNILGEIRIAELLVTAANKEKKISISQQAITIAGSRATNPLWMEIPAGGATNDCVTITHDITLLAKSVRNFSMMYDKKEKIAYWVAYPHHISYLGSTSRTDDWQLDPMVAPADQPNYFSGISGYDRGHQIPSADRTVTKVANSQTFYFTNMTPQLSTLNGQMWASLESQVRNWMAASDTLYVVTGAILKTVNGSETVKYATDAKGNKIAVPNYYYKVLLRLKTGKYDAIGFWFEHRSYGSGLATAAVTKSVRQIETLTGFNFFANLAKSVQDEAESTSNPAAWGL
jgi:endonuclease G